MGNNKLNVTIGVLSVPIKLKKVFDDGVHASPFHLYDKQGRNVIHPNCVRLENGSVEEISKESVMKGIELKDGLALFAPSEVKQIQDVTTSELKIISMERMIPPMLRTGQRYYVLPQKQKKGKQTFWAGLKQFSILMNCLDGWALIGKFVDTSRENLVAIYKSGQDLVMEKLYWFDALRTAEYPELPELTTDEKVLARKFLEQLASQKFDFANEKEAYMERINELITAKQSGKPIQIEAIAEQKQDVMELLAQAVAK